MNPQVRRVVCASGAESLPWVVDEDGDAVFQDGDHEVRLIAGCDGGVDYRSYQRDRDDPDSGYCRREKDYVYSERVKDLAWVVEQVKAAREADPRLASLPADLRAVADEFLSLHSAWGTEFDSGWGLAPHPVHLILEWDHDGDPDNHCSQASFGCSLETRRWRIFADTFGHQIEINGTLPLRRSADFAEFVQRFRRTEG